MTYLNNPLSEEEKEKRHSEKLELIHESYRQLGYKFCPYCGEKLKKEEKK